MIHTSSAPHIAFVAGRSGGHIVPCLTRIDALVKRYPRYQTLFFSTDGDLDKRIIGQNEHITYHIPLSIRPPHKASWFSYPLLLIQSCVAIVKSLYWLKRTNTHQVVTTGGYIALPVCIAARMLRIPIELHVLDVVPGKSLNYIARLAQSISVCFAESIAYLPKHKCFLQSYPVRFSKHDLQVSPTEARTALGLDPNVFTLAVFGGSQGSHSLNSLIINYLTLYKDKHPQGIQIIHQTGLDETARVMDAYNALGIRALVFGYHHDLARIYRACSLVVCRAGAGTLFEVEFFNLPGILVPLETRSTMHQLDNAHAMAQKHPDRYCVIRQHEQQVLMQTLYQNIAQRSLTDSNISTVPTHTMSQ